MATRWGLPAAPASFRLTRIGAVILLAAALATFGRASLASAHPLGNFTINRYSRIELFPGEVRLRYVVDMAEIPTFQEMARIDRDQNGEVADGEARAYLEGTARDLTSRLRLSANGSRVALRTVDQELSFPPGQAGLRTMRVSLLLQGHLRAENGPQRQTLHYRDGNYAHRLGWKEIVVQAQEGVSLLSSTAPQRDLSNELRSYPGDLLNSPPDRTEAWATFVLGAAAREQATGSALAAQPRKESKYAFTSLIAAERLTPPVVALSLVFAVGLGALHAASPGHGKTIMAAYLVGTRGTPMHALLLGLTVTITHTLGVLGLALVTLYASRFTHPETLYPWLALASGAIAMAIGIWLLLGWSRDRARNHHSHGSPDPGPGPSRIRLGPGPPPGQALGASLRGAGPRAAHHQPEGAEGLRITWRNLAALGAAGGLVPSASALVVLLAAISLNRLGFGVLLIVAFSAGMAGVLSGAGVALVYARGALERMRPENLLLDRLGRSLPLTTAVIVLGVGMAMTARAALQVQRL